MTDKSKHTTLFYSKNALSFRSFHKEGFYREKSLFTRLFCSFCRQMKLKMPLGCLSNTSRMPLEYLSDASKMPSWRDLQAAEQPVYGRRSLSCRHQHVRLQGLKRKCFPHAQSAETIRNRERFDRKMGKNIVHKDMRFVPAPCSPAILHPCDPAPLRPYTLHLTPYVFIFPLRHFGLSQSSKCKMAGAGGDALPAYSCYFLCFFIFFFITR